MTQYYISCNRGMEDISAQEILTTIPDAQVETFLNFPARLLVKTKEKPHKLLQLKSIYDLVEIKKLFILAPATPESLDLLIKETVIDEMKDAGTFRVTADRYGKHDFNSVDMQRVVGTELGMRYGTKVDLKNFDIHIRCDLLGTRGFIGIQHNKKSLSKRQKRSFNHSAGLKASLAYGMLQLADIQQNNIVLDATCGGGTIALEVALNYKGSIKIIAGDTSTKYLTGAIENAKLNGVTDRIEFKQLDVRHLDEFIDIKVDRILTNLPFGMQSGKNQNMRGLYDQFLTSAYNILKDNGRIVALTARPEIFRKVAMRIKLYKIYEERVVESGGLFPHIFILEKMI